MASAIPADDERGCYRIWEIYVSGSGIEKRFIVSIPRRSEMTEQRLSQYVVGFVFDEKM